jgi:hypothetical protein
MHDELGKKLTRLNQKTDAAVVAAVTVPESKAVVVLSLSSVSAFDR